MPAPWEYYAQQISAQPPVDDTPKPSGGVFSGPWRGYNSSETSDAGPWSKYTAQADAAPATPEEDQYTKRAKDWIAEQKAQGRDVSGGYASKIWHGLTGGLGDKIMAEVHTAAGQALSSQNMPWDERYKYELALEREKAKAASDVTGKGGTALEIASSIAPVSRLAKGVGMAANATRGVPLAGRVLAVRNERADVARDRRP